MRLLVEDTRAKPAHLPARDPQRPQHDVHGGGKVLAEPLLRGEEEEVQRPLAGPGEGRLQRIGKTALGQEPGFDRLGLVIRGGGTG